MTPSVRTEARTRARRGEGERLREELLDAAERLLIEHGTMNDVSIRSIATACGVTAPAVYLHFADKDDLFFEVCARRFTEFAELMRVAYEEGGAPPERLERMGRAYVRYGLERPEHYEVIFVNKVTADAEGRSLDDLPGMEALELLIRVIREGVESGDFRAVDPVTGAFTVWAGVHGLVMLLLGSDHYSDDMPQPDPDDLIDTALATLLHGLVAT